MRDATAEEREARRHRRIGEFLEALVDGRGAAGVDGGEVTKVTIRLPTVDQPECLVVVKAEGSDGNYVGFVGGLDLGQALLVWRAKDGAQGLKWREDVPWEQR